MEDQDNHGKWWPSNWEPDPAASVVPALASRDARGRPYRPEIKYAYSVAEDSRESRTISQRALDSLPDGRREEVESMLFRKSDQGPNYEPLMPLSSGRQSLLYKSAKSGDDELVKLANAASLGGGSPNVAGSANSTHLMPNLYSPLFLTANLQLPRDRITANAWNRAFYQMNPIVRNAVNMHATYPISKLAIRCKDKEIERKYMTMVKRTGLFRVIQKISLEYWMLGEVFPYAHFDQERKMWDRIYCHNPDYVVVKRDSVTGQSTIAIKPDPKLKDVVQSTDPAKRKYRENIDPRLVDAVAKNQYMPLDNFNISHIKNENHDYDAHGSSIIMSVWKDLVLWDLFRENKFIQADAMVNPMTLVKIGASSPDGHYPRQDELAGYRDIFEQAQYDKDFKVFTHPDVNVERVGYQGGVMDITSDMNFILDNIFIGLMVPKSLIMQEGATYASASVSLDVIKQRYEGFRTLIAEWLTDKIFAPMAEANEWYETINGQKHLVLPEIEWNQMTLYDNDQYITHLTGLIDKAPPTAPAGVSRTTLYRSLGLDFQSELANQRREAIQMTILQREMQEINKMTLSELRALDPDAQIQERAPPEEAPLPGQVPPDAAGGLPPMPDMGAPPPDGGMGMPPL